MRLAVAVLAQVASSLSNGLIVLWLARFGGVDSVGQYALVFGAYLVFLTVARAAILDPFLAAPFAGEESQTARRVVTASCLFAVPTTLAGAGLLAPFIPLGVAVTMVFALPIALVQDSLRYVAFRRERPDCVLLADGIWALSSLVAVFVLADGGASRALACWGFGALAGSLAAASAMRVRPAGIRPAATWWWCGPRNLGSALGLDASLAVATTQGLILASGAWIGTSGIGQIRAGIMTMSPATTFHSALLPTITPHVARSVPDSRRVQLLVQSLLLGVGVALCAAIAVVAEPWITPWLFGEDFPSLRPVLVPLGVGLSAGGFASGATVGVRVFGLGRAAVTARMASICGGIVAVIAALALSAGAPGVMWALAAQSTLHALILWAIAGPAMATLAVPDTQRKGNLIS